MKVDVDETRVGGDGSGGYREEDGMKIEKKYTVVLTKAEVVEALRGYIDRNTSAELVATVPPAALVEGVGAETVVTWTETDE